MAALVLLGASYGAAPVRAQNAGCVQTGDESVGSDKRHYRADEVARLAGNGFTARCDVAVRVLAPDGTIATAVVATSDLGDFAFEHLLGDVARRIWGTRGARTDRAPPQGAAITPERRYVERRRHLERRAGIEKRRQVKRSARITMPAASRSQVSEVIPSRRSSAFCTFAVGVFGSSPATRT
jgi:hypothetical protein